MPIQKVEKTFKFGILSTSYRVSLQERLLHDFREQQRLKLVDASSKDAPCRVKSAFVRSFNQEQNEISKLQLKKKAYTLIERIKRLAGVTSNGEGIFVDTSLAWRECVQLSQCEDRDVINASLDVLWISLEQTPLSDALVPVCFDVAEIILYWISNRTSRQQAISSTELRMLQIGRLIFLRLYFYHMTCKISNDAHAEFRLRLAYQLNGFDSLVPIYQNYPDAWLCARIIDHVGKMITDGLVLSMSNNEFAEMDEVNSADVKLDRGRSKNNGGHQEDTVPVTKAITEGVHALSPSLWHALDVFRAVENKFYTDLEDLHHALLGLVECDIMTKVENWLDCACALYLLGDAAHRDIDVLRTIEKLFMSTEENRKLWHKWTESKCGATHSMAPGATGPRSQCLLQSLPAELVISYALLLIDACLRSHDILIQRYALMADRANPDPLDKGNSHPTASLADLLVLQMPDPTNEWRLRYVTAMGLMLIRRSFAEDPLRSGVAVAADALLKSAPVLGASSFCRGQPAPVQQQGTVDWLTAATMTHPWYQVAIQPGVMSNKFISLPCRLGRSLAKHYLPSRIENNINVTATSTTKSRSMSSSSGTVTDADESTASKKGARERSAVENCERTASMTKAHRARAQLDVPTKHKKLSSNDRNPKQTSMTSNEAPELTPGNNRPYRTTIGDELLLRNGFQIKAAPFEKRAKNDLKNVVEDQWIKDLHASLEVEMLTGRSSSNNKNNDDSNNNN